MPPQPIPPPLPSPWTGRVQLNICWHTGCEGYGGYFLNRERLTSESMTKHVLRATALSAALLAGSLFSGPRPAHAQDGSPALSTALSGAVEGSSGRVSALERGRFAVLIDLDENRLSFMQGDLTLWSAPIGTGTGLRLETDDQGWDFSTPNGIFHVQYKEENPVWIAPDWYFVENGLPVPPPNDQQRVFPGGLGAAAVYIGHDLAIHGTDKPELLGQPVSHGCIRLSDRDAQRLYHNVQIGTEVIIVGGRKPHEPQKVVRPGEVPKTFNPQAGKKRPADPVLGRWKRLDTPELVTELSVELWRDGKQTRWPEVASLLLERGLDEADDAALVGLLSAAGALPDRAVAREFGTFLADAYGRSALRTLDVLSELSPSRRKRVAEAVVDATMLLHAGDWDAPTAPWPTRRVPRSAVDYQARRGWNALAAAEEAYRERPDADAFIITAAR